MGAAVVEVVIDTIVGLKDIVTLVVTTVGDAIQFQVQTLMTAAQFAAKVASGDFDAVKNDLRKIGIAADEAFASLAAFKAQVAQGANMLYQITSDPMSRQLIMDYLDSLYQSIEYRDSRVIPIKIVSLIGIEVLLALATAGAGNLARRAGQAATTGAKATKATRIGPFTVQAIDKMAELARALDKPALKVDNPPIKVYPPDPPKKPTAEKPKDQPANKARPKTVGSFQEAEKRLAIARKVIEKRKAAGLPIYTPKYSDSKLIKMAKAGTVSNERYQVRFMEKSYLNDRNSPDVPLSGKMGGTFEGESGKGVKYWSTSFDQLEDADTDPKLISEKLGIKYDPNKEYALVLVDNEKAATISGTKAITPTFKDLGNFAKEELPSQFDTATINKVYTHEYQAKYNQLYNEAGDRGFDVWDKQGIEDFQSLKNMGNDEAKLFGSRVSLHGKLGSNEDFLGNGLTKNLIEGTNSQYGVVETFTFERTPQNLAALKKNGAITIIDNLKPIN